MPTPEFILRLREKLGHELLWLPGATAVVLDHDRVLLVRRADNHEWTPVTGIVDPGEHPADTAAREALEETGVTCEVEALTGVTVTDVHVYDNGDRSQYVDHTFRCRYVRGEPHPADDESVDVRWFPLAAMPRMSTEMLERIRSATAGPGLPVAAARRPTD